MATGNSARTAEQASGAKVPTEHPSCLDGWCWLGLLAGWKADEWPTICGRTSQNADEELKLNNLFVSNIRRGLKLGSQVPTVVGGFFMVIEWAKDDAF